MMSYFEPDKIPYKVFVSSDHGYSNVIEERALELLIKYSMIYSQPTAKTLSIHRLVQEVTRINLKEDGSKEETVLKQCLSLFIENVDEEQVGHAKSVFDYGSCYPTLLKEFCAVPVHIANTMMSMGNKEYSTFAKKALELLSTCLDSSRVEIIHLEYFLATHLFEHCKYDECMDAFRQVLSKYESVSDRKRHEFMIWLVQRYIADTLHGQKKYEESLKLAKFVFQNQLKIPYSSHAEPVKTASTIFLNYLQLGKYKEALKWCDKMLATFYVCEQQQMSEEEAENNDCCLKEIGKRVKKLLEKDNIWSLFGLRLHCVLEAKGSSKESLQIAKKLYDKNSKVYGDENWMTLICQLKVALLNVQVGKYQEAVSIFRNPNIALLIKEEEEVMGKRVTTAAFAKALSKTGHHQQALQKLSESHDIYLKKYGEEHRYVVSGLYDIASVYGDMESYELSLETLFRAQAVAYKVPDVEELLAQIRKRISTTSKLLKESSTDDEDNDGNANNAIIQDVKAVSDLQEHVDPIGTKNEKAREEKKERTLTTEQKPSSFIKTEPEFPSCESNSQANKTVEERNNDDGEPPVVTNDILPSQPSSSSTYVQHAMRTPDKWKQHANIRREGDDQMTRLKETNIYYMEGWIIGGGATSTVFKGLYGKTPAAIKRIRSNCFNVYENELNIWQQVNRQSEKGNVNIVKLFAWEEFPEITGKFYYFAMELATVDLGGRIKYLVALKTDGTAEKLKELEVEENKLRHFIEDAALALSWIHNSEILHRDIKPENILLFVQRSGREIAKLNDFGTSRKLSTETNSMRIAKTDWMSPEAINAMHWVENFKSKAIDIFSLGMTAHFALSLGTHPFGRSSEYGEDIAMNIQEKEIQAAILDHPDFAAKHLIRWMLQKEAEQRPKIISVVNHPYFWENKKCLEFLVDVAICFDTQEKPALNEIRKYVNNSYNDAVFVPLKKNWVERMEKKTLDLLSNIKNHSRNYKGKGDLVMVLVKLIRDKWAHKQQLPDELAINEKYFGENGSFSSEKYISYFLSIFPELVIYLFCIVAEKKDEPDLKELKKNYFRHFDSVPLMRNANLT